MRLFCVLALSLACTSTAPADEKTTADPPPPKTKSKADDPVELPPASFIEPTRTHLLLQAHENTQINASYVMVDLAAWKLGESTSQLTLPMENWPDHYRPMASHDGGDDWALAVAAPGGHVVQIRRDGPEGRTATAPTALHQVGELVLVGLGTQLGYLDFREKDPSFQQLKAMPDNAFKAYDLFVRSGDFVVAVDDVVTPIYADTLWLSRNGKPIAHAAAWQLPGLINGRYYAGALRRKGESGGTLFMLGEYGIMDGSGQDLAALPVENGKSTVTPDTILNASQLASPPVLEEHVSRHTGKPEKLAYGTEYTSWRGIGLRPGPRPEVLLAAGKRGLLVVPAGFGPSTKAERLDVGDCLDVLVDDERIFVLLGGDEPAVVELNADLTEKQRLALDRAYQQIVD
jgi:hypothetical protein